MESLKRMLLIFLLFSTLTSCRYNEIMAEADPKTEAEITQEEIKKDQVGELMLESWNTPGIIDMTQFDKKELDVPYTKSETGYQLLDIIYPEKAPPPYKPILVLHSGKWLSGDKRSGTLAAIFQATHQGYAVVSANYGLGKNGHWPQPLYDAKAAIRFLRANAEKYRLDTDEIVVLGISAGGHLAEMLAATNGDEEFEDLTMGFPEASSEVQGVVSWYGISDLAGLSDKGSAAASAMFGFNVRDPEYSSQASPVHLIDPDFPPMLLIHGTEDQIVPISQSVTMVKKVNETTGMETAELIRLEGGTHAGPEKMDGTIIIRSLDFIDRILYDSQNPYRHSDYRKILTRDDS